MRVLVVDDEPDLRLILRINLERWGHEVTLAASAAEAWDVLSGDEVDALLLDVSMPGETGLELLQRLRIAGRTPPEVALLTAMVHRHEPIRDGEPPVRVLAKPFGIDELRDLVQTMAGEV